MDTTTATYMVAVSGLLITGLLAGAQLIALFKPHDDWTIENVYGGNPESTDPRAFFSFNQGLAWADILLWAPVQIAGSIGMLVGERWGFLLGLMGSVPLLYSAILIYIWDRDLGFRRQTLFYWLVVWGMFPVFGVIELFYCLTRLLAE